MNGLTHFKLVWYKIKLHLTILFDYKEFEEQLSGVL